jgi:hypothetical protein
MWRIFWHCEDACHKELGTQAPKRTTAADHRFAARRAKELGADAIIVLAQGSEYAGTVNTGNAFTSGNFYPGGFNATTTGTNVSVPLMLGKAQVIAIKWR